MWPFKKRVESQVIVPKTFTTVICIPGTWNSWNEFSAFLVVATKGEYFVVGNILTSTKKQRNYNVEFCEADDTMKRSFEYAGRITNLTYNFLDEIANHKHVVYISGPTGDIKEAEHIAYAAEAVLKSGGIGIKIETAGKAFEKSKWCNMLENFKEPNLYEMFVVDCLTDKVGFVFSCGMQNLGYRDTVVYGEEMSSALELISIFGYYQIVDKPTILDGQTFRTSTSSPRFKITSELCQPYEGDELFSNPFGMWRLTRE